MLVTIIHVHVELQGRPIGAQYGKIIRIESKFIRESGRSAPGVRLLNVEAGDRVAAVVIPPEEPNGNGMLLQ